MEQRAKALSCKVGVLVLLSFWILVLGLKAAHKERKNRLGWVGLISRVSSHSVRAGARASGSGRRTNLGISGPGPVSSVTRLGLVPLLPHGRGTASFQPIKAPVCPQSLSKQRLEFYCYSTPPRRLSELSDRKLVSIEFPRSFHRL